MKLKHKLIDTESEHFLLSDRALLVLFIMVVLLFAGLLYMNSHVKIDEHSKLQKKQSFLEINYTDKSA